MNKDFRKIYMKILTEVPGTISYPDIRELYEFLQPIVGNTHEITMDKLKKSYEDMLEAYRKQQDSDMRLISMLHGELANLRREYNNFRKVMNEEVLDESQNRQS